MEAKHRSFFAKTVILRDIWQQDTNRTHTLKFDVRLTNELMRKTQVKEQYLFPGKKYGFMCQLHFCCLINIVLLFFLLAMQAYP